MVKHDAPTDVIRTTFLGCVADDVTGATDLSLNLVQGGMRVVQWLGVPEADQLHTVDADAIVVALKSRSIESTDAIGMSLKSLATLRAIGCQRFYFKYCSTFDSTDDGNIGPVAESLLEALGAEQTIFCPAFPAAGRTVYAGHLFVNHCLLHESGMQNHPLNPMHDPCLQRVLQRQTRQAVGLVPYGNVAAGSAAIVHALRDLQIHGKRFVLVDTLDEHHLRSIATACVDFPLVTGGSGLARYLPEAYRVCGLLETEPLTPTFPTPTGRRAILSGSCSQATRAQVARQRDHAAVWQIDPVRMMAEPESEFRAIVQWAGQQPIDATLMIYSTAHPETVAAAQRQFGREPIARQIEQLQARIATVLVEQFGVRQLIVAGGETSSAVAAALGVQALRIGPEIAPGVPWTESLGGKRLALAFKSGNFGGEDFFQTAWEMLA